MDERRHDTLRELVSMQQRMNRLLEGAIGLREKGGESIPFWEPSADILENSDEMVVILDLPGVDERDIHVMIDEGMLIVSGERKESAVDAVTARCERPSGPFRRVFHLPVEVDREKVTAQTERGVLTVRLPRHDERRSEPVRIRIRNG